MRASNGASGGVSGRGRPGHCRRSIVADGLTIARPAHLAGPCAAHSPRRPLEVAGLAAPSLAKPTRSLTAHAARPIRCRFRRGPGSRGAGPSAPPQRLLASIGQGARGPFRHRPWCCAPLRGGPAEDLCRRGPQRNVGRAATPQGAPGGELSRQSASWVRRRQLQRERDAHKGAANHAPGAPAPTSSRARQKESRRVGPSSPRNAWPIPVPQRGEARRSSRPSTSPLRCHRRQSQARSQAAPSPAASSRRQAGRSPPPWSSPAPSAPNRP
jgi:hypothetical protein